MPALANRRHELFAQALARGESAAAAYSEAFGSKNRGQASRLQREASVVERVAALVEEGAEIERAATAQALANLALTKERVLAELAMIGFANMADYMRAGPDGDPYLSFADLTREQSAALAEVTVEDFKDGRGADARDVRRTKFKLHDKRAALVDLGRHLQLFPRQVELTGKGGGPIETSRSLMSLTDEELIAIAAGERR